MTAPLQLRDDVTMVVAYRDHNPAGSPVSRGPAVVAREVFAPMVEHLREHGRSSLIDSSAALLEHVRRSAEFARIAENVGEAWRVRDEVLYPDPANSLPGGLALRRPSPTTGVDDLVEAPVGLADWPALHEIFSGLATAEGLPRSEVPARFGDFINALLDRGFVAPRVDEEVADAPVTFVGHNTTVVRSPTTSVITDPFLLSPAVGVDGYHPLPRRLLGPIDAILITHSHPDHFDPSSLLRFDPAVPVVVPVCERETILAVDLALRLAQLGFTDVRTLGWWESLTIGDVTITALPFYGEQPGDGAVLHPDIRNVGNTYLVDGPNALGGDHHRVAFLADSGADHLGDGREVAAKVASSAPVDLVFSGYRGWHAYPAELLTSSVAQYLYFIPPDQWTQPLQLMAGPAECVEVGERFGARLLVPYADGGGPWHWQIGLGPVLDGTGAERAEFDPFPERVVEAAAGSPVDVVILRPGDSLVADPAGGRRVERRPGYAWPYGE